MIPPTSPRACTVAILCGGRGTRLRPLTDTLPKGMVPVGGKPMLEHILHQYTRYGFRQFVLCIGYQGEVIRRHFAHPPAGVEIRFADAGEEAGMLQRLWQAREHLAPRTIVAYCDTFIAMDPALLLDHHIRHQALATLVTAPIRNPFGVVETTAGHRVTRFVEKPVHDCFIGCFVLERTALDHLAADLPSQPDGQGLVALFSQLSTLGHLVAYPHAGVQINFNTVSERQEAEEALSRYYTCTERE